VNPHVPNDPVIAWLLDADPAIRWQVLLDLIHAPADVVVAERSRVASEGWGARLLDRQRPDGQWGDGVSTPFWWTNMYTLVFLRDLGIDPTSAPARAAIDRIRSQVTWGAEFGHSPFFDGEIEPCINGRVVALGGYFGVRSDRLVDRLLGEQLADGGWNCEAERGSTRGEAYLLDRRLLRRLSTGEIIDPAWTRLAFPPLWHYDVLRALDYLRAAGTAPDSHTTEALSLIRDRRQPDGRWLLDVRHRDTLYEDMAGAVAEANRWITLGAMRVLEWGSRE
jgi:hypothetical protein